MRRLKWSASVSPLFSQFADSRVLEIWLSTYVNDVYSAGMERLHTVAETLEFARRAKALGIGEPEIAAIADVLARSPEAGNALGGGLFKIRIARQGGGKSGGFRTIYFYRSRLIPIFLLTIFAKNERSNISATELAELKAIGDEIALNYGKSK